MSLVALGLSLSTAAVQFIDWARGARVSVVPPERVILYGYQPQSGPNVVRVAAALGYVNTGSSSNMALLSEEQATVVGLGEDYSQTWLNFGEPRRKDGFFAPEYGASAVPQPIGGGGASGHTTFFSTRADCSGQTRDCRGALTSEHLIEALGAKKRFEVRFSSRISGLRRLPWHADARTIVSSCKPRMPADAVDQWTQHNFVSAWCERPSVL